MGKADVRLQLLRHKVSGCLAHVLRDHDVAVPSVQLAGVAGGSLFAACFNGRKHLRNGGMHIRVVRLCGSGRFLQIFHGDHLLLHSALPGHETFFEKPHQEIEGEGDDGDDEDSEDHDRGCRNWLAERTM